MRCIVNTIHFLQRRQSQFNARIGSDSIFVSGWVAFDQSVFRILSRTQCKALCHYVNPALLCVSCTAARTGIIAPEVPASDMSKNRVYGTTFHQPKGLWDHVTLNHRVYGTTFHQPKGLCI